MESMGMSITAEQIRAARERLEMTQQDLADELGVSLRTVGNWERGDTVPRNRMAPLADVLRLAVLPEFGEEALLRRLGSLAKRRREELGLTARAFAIEANISDKTIREFEFGRQLPIGTTRAKIEKALGWRPGIIEDTIRQVGRKASNIQMEDLDAEDSLHLASAGGPGLTLVSNEALLAELGRRLRLGVTSGAEPDVRDLYGLAASTNSEHLEDDNGER